MTWSLRRPARKASALIEERMRLDELELLQKRPSREFLVLMPVSWHFLWIRLARFHREATFIDRWGCKMSASSLSVYNLAMDFDMTVSFDFCWWEIHGSGTGGTRWKSSAGRMRPAETHGDQLKQLPLPTPSILDHFGQAFCLWILDDVGTSASRFRWCFSRWWFQFFSIFSPTWGNDPIWLIFSRWVE